MSQSAKAQEPSMEEILASIRRIIADDEGGKAAKAPEPAPAAAPNLAAAPAAPAAGNNQDDIDAMLANYGFNYRYAGDEDAVALTARLDRQIGLLFEGASA